MDLLQKALNIAKQAHEGQKDKGGNDYVLHPMAVSEMVSGETAKIVALLHDTVEDTNITLEALHDVGFSGEVIHAVDCLTKKVGESRNEYLLRVKSNSIAIQVKLADLKHNSDLSRINEPTDSDHARVDVYKSEIEFLS